MQVAPPPLPQQAKGSQVVATAHGLPASVVVASRPATIHHTNGASMKALLGGTSTNPRPKATISQQQQQVKAITSKDSHDTRASNIISISRGPPQDHRFFYSTMYSTTYKAYHNPLLKGPINGIHTRDLHNHKIKQRSGYSKNLAMFVNYDKAVDESDDFRITEPYLTRTCSDYSPPPPLKDYLENPKAGITPMVPSGFTRLPLFNVTQDGSSKFIIDKNTLMKASYPDGQLKFKESHVNKKFILPSATAYISDEGEIKSIGNGNPEVFTEQDRFAPDPMLPAKPASKPWECPGADKMRLDGYSRSTRPKDPLQTDYGVMPEIDSRLLQPAVLEKTKHTNLPEWVHCVDSHAEHSFSRMVHPPMDPMASLKSLKNAPVRIGLKEPTGGVQNNDKFVFKPEPNPAERFLTETTRRFQAPSKTHIDPTCNTLVKSGFSDGNRYVFTNPATTDGEVYSKMHPTVAKYNWLNERGLHTNRPNKMHVGYTMKVE
ncbi:hypothetical protein BC830DRAFT_1164059 [Chytriomyces sp. MP71]|nr:hypothetical protein BC830DRAFT_1164059 [Chytriomyces sp. MP71]